MVVLARKLKSVVNSVGFVGEKKPRFRGRPNRLFMLGEPLREAKVSTRIRPKFPRERVLWSRKFVVFNNAHNINALKLDRTFFKSLSSKTKVLEIGAGSGRLMQFLLDHSALRSENVVLADIAYGSPSKMPPLKKGIYSLYKSGKIKLRKADMWASRFKKSEFDHILVSEAMIHPIVFDNVGFDLSSKDPRIVAIKSLVSRLLPAVKQGGTLRVSPLIPPYIECLKQENVFKGLDVEFTSGGMVITKNNLPIK